MAAPPSPRSGSPDPAPSTPKRRNITEGSSIGLRNSCEACASSKVKCSGRKPTCHRCDRRGFTCEYSVAKRAGRKPAGSGPGPTGTTSNGSGEAQQTTRSEVETAQSVPVESGPTFASPRDAASELPDMWPGMDPHDYSLFTELSNVNEAASVFTPLFPMELPALDTPAPVAPMTVADNPNSSIFDNGGTDDSSLEANLASLSQHQNNDPTADLFNMEATGLATPMTRESHSLQRSPANGQSCSCLAQAMCLMKRLSDSMSSLASPGTTRSEEAAVQAIQDILQENKAAIDAANGMLKCQGRHDGYLLVVISLTAFKILELFAAILRESPSRTQAQNGQAALLPLSDSAPTTAIHIEGYSIEDGDWVRPSAQAILGDLHNVRRVMKLVSEKTRVPVTTSAAGSSSTTASSTTGTTTPEVADKAPWSSRGAGVSEGEVRLPFSTEVFTQLERDLDVRIKAMSQQVIRRLRDF